MLFLGEGKNMADGETDGRTHRIKIVTHRLTNGKLFSKVGYKKYICWLNPCVGSPNCVQ